MVNYQVAPEAVTMSEAVRLAFDAVAAARDATAHGLVVIAGAGLSMGPPSLPSWTAINNAFLENLALRLAAHTGGEVGYDVANFVLGRRETADVAQPDLQAQLAKESLGEQYFALFKPLDIATWNDGHAAIAALAATGFLRAVVTTNFDRLIELAIDAAGAHASVYCAPEDFERLSNQLVDEPAPVAIPVIKVHGSVDRAATMVDTLRPKALEAALTRLFCNHAVLVVGFSGADLAYDPHYLGLRQGAAGSPSVTVVNREGDPPKAALGDLVASAGAQRASSMALCPNASSQPRRPWDKAAPWSSRRSTWKWSSRECGVLRCRRKRLTPAGAHGPASDLPISLSPWWRKGRRVTVAHFRRFSRVRCSRFE